MQTHAQPTFIIKHNLSKSNQKEHRSDFMERQKKEKKKWICWTSNFSLLHNLNKLLKICQQNFPETDAFCGVYNPVLAHLHGLAASGAGQGGCAALEFADDGKTKCESLYRNKIRCATGRKINKEVSSSNHTGTPGQSCWVCLYICVCVFLLCLFLGLRITSL